MRHAQHGPFAPTIILSPVASQIKLVPGDAFHYPDEILKPLDEHGGDAKRELGSRAQAGMCRDRFVHRQIISRGQAEGVGEKGEITSGAFGI